MTIPPIQTRRILMSEGYSEEFEIWWEDNGREIASDLYNKRMIFVDHAKKVAFEAWLAGRGENE